MADAAAAAPRNLLDAVPGLKQVGLLVGVAAAIAAAIWLVLWSQGPNYTVLYGQLSERESGQVMDALTASGIDFKLNPAGAIMVPEAKLQDARIKLASQGLPQSDAMGMDLLQKDSSFGTSSMMERLRYQAMMETELARTITKLQGVESARVHLAMPTPSVFVRDSHRATASVFLQLYPGRQLDPGQVAAIVHLVASSVPDLTANDVTVVDQSGNLLNSPDQSPEAAATNRQFAYTRKLEDSYQQRIVALLEPIVGPGRVHATVTADVDFTVAEETHENYDPKNTAVRSEQESSDVRTDGGAAMGIPGALSNQPPGTTGAPALPGASGPGQANAANAAPGSAKTATGAAANGAPGAAAGGATTATPTENSSTSTRNFEIDRTLSYTKQPEGIVKRLNVGVVLDDWQKVGPKGKVTAVPMSAQDIQRLTKLVSDAIGLQSSRGDQISLINQRFESGGPLPPVEQPPLWERPWVLQLAKQLVGALLVLLVAFLVLRPLMKSLTAAGPKRAAGALGADLAGDQLTLSGQAQAPAIKLAPSFEQQIAAARALVIQDPKKAAQVVKDWVADG
ncbi:MAG: flagellar M-ring protein FliF [Gammaproteobacteria bacterium]|nr:flagellar M-ring protein FliF [Gammaproteobacteria bacterium]